MLDFPGQLVALKLNIKRYYEEKYVMAFFEEKYIMGFGGGLYSHRRRNKEPPLIEVRVSGI